MDPSLETGETQKVRLIFSHPFPNAAAFGSSGNSLFPQEGVGEVGNGGKESAGIPESSIPSSGGRRGGKPGAAVLLPLSSAFPQASKVGLLVNEGCWSKPTFIRSSSQAIGKVLACTS